MTQTWEESIQPSHKNLARHIAKFGLDREPKGYHQGKEKTYKTYRSFRNDSACEVAREPLSEDAYAQFVDRFGDANWVDEARTDWRDARGETA